MRRRAKSSRPSGRRRCRRRPVPPAPPLAPEPGRFSLLKKPLTDKPDPYAALRSPAAAPGNR